MKIIRIVVILFVLLGLNAPVINVFPFFGTPVAVAASDQEKETKHKQKEKKKEAKERNKPNKSEYREHKKKLKSEQESKKQQKKQADKEKKQRDPATHKAEKKQKKQEKKARKQQYKTAKKEDARNGVVLDDPKDCGDFDSQAAAELYFESKGGPQKDPSDLDRDGDGKACESL